MCHPLETFETVKILVVMEGKSLNQHSRHSLIAIQLLRKGFKQIKYFLTPKNSNFIPNIFGMKPS